MTNDSDKNLTITLKPFKVRITKYEIVGGYCRAWQEKLSNKYFFQFDVGHFMSKMKTVEISENEYLALRSGSIPFDELTQKYS